MRFAITRDVSPSIQQCELTHVDRAPIDFSRARIQHTAYCDDLVRRGLTVIRLPALPEFPDSVFVEDTAIVTDELAVLTNPGATSRRGEIATMPELLKKFRPIEFVQSPGTLDGGDVLVAGKDVWVGVGGRTNREGFESLCKFLKPHGYRVRSAQARGCLHLKSAVTRASSDCFLLNPRWIDPHVFCEWETIEIDPSEPFAANVLWLGDATLVSKSHPRTRGRLEAQGVKCRSVDMSELAKAEGGLTCCSILFDA